jgi:regulator of protease activity HflC (stomatin/prohibitin superfamily)
MVFSDCLSGQSRINDHLRGEFSKLFHDWGIYVHRMELLDLAPQLNVREQMKKQMIAERVRRGDFIRSEGKKVCVASF